MATNLSLSEITNTYGTYRGNSLVGPRNSVGTVPNDGLEGISGVNFPFLAGIVIKINGQSYADSGWLNSVKVKGNPYLSKRSLPTISFTLDQLVNDPIPETYVHGAVTRSKYSESFITKRMSTINDVLFYLNDFFNPKNSDEVLSTQSFGATALNTTQYDVEIDVVGGYPGFEFEEFGEALTPPPSLPPTATEAKTPPPEPIVETVEEKPIPINPPKPEEIMQAPLSLGIDNFLLNESIEFTRNTLSNPQGLAMTGLKDAYDTGLLGPMASILDELEMGQRDNLNNGYSPFGGFNNF